ncbi:MAG TPA: hypothetical protein PKE64_18940 [Anaerolineae bacterium]|nr:hypothetical protein [Anaerolineae bacterium]
MPQAFWQALNHAFEQAISLTGSMERTYSLAGYRVRLRFAGPALLPVLTPALDHLQTTNAGPPPDLTIALWDSATTGIPFPARLPPLTEIGRRGELPAYSDDRFLAAAQTDIRALSLLDRVENQALYWTAASAVLPVFERAAPLKIILHWWLRERRLPLIHAGAVGAEAGGVLLVGGTGTGKSTSTLACLSAGLQYISDDRCLLALEPEPRALCVYNAAKLRPEQMQRFPHLLPAVRANNLPDEEKHIIFVHQYAPEQLATALPVRALLLARLAHRPETTWHPVSPARVWRELSTSSLVYQPGMAHAELELMAELVRRLPCYQLNLGTELGEIPPVIAQVIQAHVQ